MTRLFGLWFLLAAAFVFARFITSWFIQGSIEVTLEVFVSAAVVSAIQTAVLKSVSRRQTGIIRE